METNSNAESDHITLRTGNQVVAHSLYQARVEKYVIGRNSSPPTATNSSPARLVLTETL